MQERILKLRQSTSEAVTVGRNSDTVNG